MFSFLANRIDIEPRLRKPMLVNMVYTNGTETTTFPILTFSNAPGILFDVIDILSVEYNNFHNSINGSYIEKIVVPEKNLVIEMRFDENDKVYNSTYDKIAMLACGTDLLGENRHLYVNFVPLHYTVADLISSGTIDSSSLSLLQIRDLETEKMEQYIVLLNVNNDTLYPCDVFEIEDKSWNTAMYSWSAVRYKSAVEAGLTEEQLNECWPLNVLPLSWLDDLDKNKQPFEYIMTRRAEGRPDIDRLSVICRYNVDIENITLYYMPINSIVISKIKDTALKFIGVNYLEHEAKYISASYSDKTDIIYRKSELLYDNTGKYIVCNSHLKVVFQSGDNIHMIRKYLPLEISFDEPFILEKCNDFDEALRQE